MLDGDAHQMIPPEFAEPYVDPAPQAERSRVFGTANHRQDAIHDDNGQPWQCRNRGTGAQPPQARRWGVVYALGAYGRYTGDRQPGLQNTGELTRTRMFSQR